MKRYLFVTVVTAISLCAGNITAGPGSTDPSLAGLAAGVSFDAFELSETVAAADKSPLSADLNGPAGTNVYLPAGDLPVEAEIPEPSALALGVFSAAVFGVLRRRRTTRT